MGRITNPLSAPVVHCTREVTTEDHGTNPCGVRLVSATSACPNSDNHDMLSDGDCDAPRISE